MVVVQELELAMNLELYGLGNQYILGSLSWLSLTFVHVQVWNQLPEYELVDLK